MPLHKLFSLSLFLTVVFALTAKTCLADQLKIKEVAPDFYQEITPILKRLETLLADRDSQFGIEAGKARNELIKQLDAEIARHAKQGDLNKALEVEKAKDFYKDLNISPEMAPRCPEKFSRRYLKDFENQIKRLQRDRSKDRDELLKKFQNAFNDQKNQKVGELEDQKQDALSIKDIQRAKQIQDQIDQLKKLEAPLPQPANPAPKLKPASPPPAVVPFNSAVAQQHQKNWAAFLKVPQRFTDPKSDLDFVLIPPGSYQMGLTLAQVNAVLAGGGQQATFTNDINAVCPPRQVNITEAFYLSVDEIAGSVRKDWNAAEADCKKRSAGQPPNTYRLPTSAEWEFACRAGNPNPDVANPNAWGLKNMKGGLSEWVSDWYSAKDTTAGNDPSGPPIPPIEKWKIHRGSGWNSHALAGVSAYRSGATPNTSSTNIGYRICLSVAAVQKNQRVRELEDQKQDALSKKDIQRAKQIQDQIDQLK